MAIDQIPATLREFARRFDGKRVEALAAKYRIQPTSPDAPLSEFERRQLFVGLAFHHTPTTPPATVATAPAALADAVRPENVLRSNADDPDHLSDSSTSMHSELQSEIQSLRVQVTALTDRLVESKETNAKLEERHAKQFRAMADELEAQAEQRVQVQIAIAERLRDEANRLLAERDQLQTQLRALELSVRPQLGISEREHYRLKHELEQAREREANLSQRLQAAQQASTQQSEGGPALARENAELRTQLAMLRGAKQERDRLAEESDRHRQSISALQRQLEESQAQLRALSHQLRLSDQRRQATDRPASPAAGRGQTARAPTIELPTEDRPEGLWASSPRILRWARSRPTLKRFSLPAYVAACGHGPKSLKTMQSILKKHGADAVQPGDERASVMVLGRDGWLIDDIEAQIRARSGQDLFIYSQEMLELALQVGADPFLTADAATLKEFADGHPALECCIEEGFLWPSIPTAKISKRLEAMIDQVAESPLHKIGYRVGRTDGAPTSTRREILDSAFNEKLPHVESKDYMAEWGQPGSRRRLRRIARLIAWQVGGARGRAEKLGHDMSAATRDWLDDLEWMKRDLYEPWMRFRWPDIKVPDAQGRPNRATRRRKGT